MKRLSIILALALLAGCIENDIPYPVVECSVKSIEAKGLSGDPVIDAAARKVTLPLEETTNIEAVEITASPSPTKPRYRRPSWDATT